MKKLLIGILATLTVLACAAGCSFPGFDNSADNESSSNTSSESTSDNESDSDSESSEPAEVFTLTLRNGNPMMGGTMEELSIAEGAALELPTLEAEGKTFLGWFDVDGNEAPATMPAESIALYANWEITAYTLTIVNGEASTEIKFGVEYTNDILATVNDLAYVLEDNLVDGYVWAEEIPETFELKDYTFTMQKAYTLTLRSGNPLTGVTSESFSYVEGAELTLPVLEEVGKNFLGWFDIDGNVAPATMPASDVAYFATWEVIPYTLTIVNGEASTEIKFGVEYANDIMATVNDLAYVLEDNLPANTIEFIYSWAEEIPATFELKDYTFTVVATEAPKYDLTLRNGNPMMGGTSEIVSYYAGATLELPVLTAEGKKFLGWYSMDENNEPTVAAPQTMPAEAIALFAVWEITPYTLTIKQDGVEDKVFTFAVEYTNDITISVNDLAYVLEDNLPQGEVWVESVPETFELKDYTFTVKTYKALSLSEANAAVDGTFVQVSGTVCAINTAWNDSYNNISVTIKDEEGNSLYLFRLATNVALGDIITVKGTMATYNNARQIAAGATAEITGHDASYDYVEVSIAEALKVADNTNVIVTGTVVKIGTAYSSQYDNISVYIADDNGTQLYLYRLSGNVNVNDIIKVKGAMATYNGNRQLTGGTFENVGTHACANYTEATCTTPATCIVCGVAKDDVLADHNYVDGVCTVCNSTESGTVVGETTVNVDFSTFSKGVQYADETVVINNNLTISTHNKGCHFNTQLRLYDSASNDGWAILTCSSVVSRLTFNAGYKTATLNVYGSTDGSTWTLIEGAATSSSFKDYDISVDKTAGYKYIKLDASGNQIRIANLSVTMG